MQIRNNNIARFLSYIHFNINTGCWDWLGEKRGNGNYAAIYIDGQYVRAYRYSYFLFVGAIPNQLEPDHICRNRICVNPYHLEWVTHQENMRRSRRQTCRKFNHPLTRQLSGKAVCKICKNTSNQKSYHKLMEGNNERR